MQKFGVLFSNVLKSVFFQNLGFFHGVFDLEKFESVK